MATKKKKEEQNLKTLRELTSLTHNKKCLECQERGPTYADMTTHGFVCTACSGYLRGLNPPHRVKSISMTTFIENELEQLKNGGNELAHAIWMGRWNPRQDKEPSKKDEVAYKEFLIAKYERKQWYRSPAEVRKEREKESGTPPVEPKLLPPPSTKRSAGTATSAAVQPPSSRPPAATTATATTATVAATTTSTPPTATRVQKPDLLGGLDSDPFAPKVPAGGVAVFPTGGVPLLGASKEVLQPATSGSSSTPQTSTSQQQTLGDKYAALASLDMTLKELRVQEPTPQPPQQQQPQSQGQVLGGGGGGGNPFGAPTVPQPVQPQGQQFNPFSAPPSQPVTGGPRPMGPGYGMFQGAPQMVGGMGMPIQQFGVPPQQFGGYGQPMQQMGQPMQQMGQPMGQQQMGQQQMGQMGMGPFMQQQPQIRAQQWGQQPQAFPGQMMQGQWGAQQQIPGMMPQQQQQQQQQQWGAGGQQGFGAMQSGMMPQTGRGFGPVGMAPAQQITPQQSQFGSFVSAGPSQIQSPPAQQQQQQPKPGGGFNWGASTSISQPPFSSSAATVPKESTGSSLSGMNVGWSSGLTRAPPSSSEWGGSSTTTVTEAPSGWSTSLQMTTPQGMRGVMGGSGVMQPQPAWGVSSQPSNPFTSSPQNHRNPFL